MSVLAIITDDDSLSAAEAARQVDLLRRAQDYVRASDDLDELLDARRKAAVVATWVRVHNAAEAIALEACKLDWLALRKIAAIDPYKIKGTNVRASAEWMAGMPQEEFDRRLAALTYPVGPVTAHRHATARERMEHARALGRGEVFDGGGYSAAEIAQLADDLLSAASAEGMASVAGLREAVKDALVLGDNDTFVDQGVEQVIRQALRSQSLPDGYPAWVTWWSPSVGWVHLPWDAATLEQLEWMAEFRRDQAAALARSARELDGLVRIMRACSARLGGAKRLAALRQYREAQQARRDRAADEREAAVRKPWRGEPRPERKAPKLPCTGTASKGRPCRNPAAPGSDRCEHHPR